MISKSLFIFSLIVFLSACGDSNSKSVKDVTVRDLRNLGIEQVLEGDTYEFKQTQDSELRVLGYLEYAEISPGNHLLKAKLDTGALTSSLDTIDYEEFEKNGEAWIRFTYAAAKGKSTTVERKKVRVSQIKTHGNVTSDRPVVTMSLRVGDRTIETEVNLANRKNFIYPLLLGRKFLRDAKIAVDPQRSFVIPLENYKPKTAKGTL